MSDFQATASAQGRSFEQAVEFLLQAQGWLIEGRHIVVEGVEIDLVATDGEGTRWWIECKGSFRGNVPGSKRGDTVKKAVGVAWFLSTLPHRCPYMLVTSHMPNADTVGERLLMAARAGGLFTRIEVVSLLAGFEEENE